MKGEIEIMVMDSLRHQKVVKVVSIIVALSFIAGIFLLWGMKAGAGSMRRGGDIIGKINGDNIHSKQFIDSYKQLYENYKNQGGEINANIEKMLLEQAWETVIRDYIFQKNIKDLKIVVSNSEIVDYIKNNPPEFIKQYPQFMTNGVFDQNKYFAALADEKIDWRWLETSVKEYLPKKKLQDIIMGNVRITDVELKEAYIEDSTKVKLEYVKLGLPDIKEEVQVSDDEMKTYYNEHKEEYKVGDQAKIDYILIQNASGDQVRASHILVKIDDKRKEAEAKKLIDKVYAEALSGKDFGALAKQYSEDPGSSQNGGDLGYFSRGKMVAEFDSVAFSLPVGKISTPFKTSYGYHIVKTLDKKKGETQEEIDKKAKKLLEKVKSKVNIADAAKEFGYEVMNTGYFTSDREFVPGFGNAPEIVKKAFSSKPGTVCEDFYETPYGKIIYVISDFKKAHTQEFEEVKFRIKNELTMKKKEKVLSAKIDEIRASLKITQNLDEIAAKYGLKKETTNLISKKDYIAGLGADTPLQAVAVYSKVGDLIGPVDVYKTFVIAKVIEKVDAPMVAFEQNKEILKKKMLEERRQAYFQDWYQAERSALKIKDYRSKVFNNM